MRTAVCDFHCEGSVIQSHLVRSLWRKGPHSCDRGGRAVDRYRSVQIDVIFLVVLYQAASCHPRSAATSQLMISSAGTLSRIMLLMTPKPQTCWLTLNPKPQVKG